MMPYLGRGFIGDGVATMVAGVGGGTGVTTYAENIGVMAVTRVYSTLIFVTPQIVENASDGTDDLKRNFRVKVK